MISEFHVKALKSSKSGYGWNGTRMGMQASHVRLQQMAAEFQ